MPKKSRPACDRNCRPTSPWPRPRSAANKSAKCSPALQLNLQAMSLVSLLVGMFLIYNTIEASVIRRRHEIGILRSLGVTRGEVRALFLGEAAVLGLAGIALGLAGGYFLARALVGTVAETISSLYVLLSVREVVVAPWIWLSALLLGFVSVLAAAWLPARAAAAMDPVETLHRGARLEKSVRLSRGWILAAVVSLLLAVCFFLSGPADRARRGSDSARLFLSSPAFLASRRNSPRASAGSLGH